MPNNKKKTMDLAAKQALINAHTSEFEPKNVRRSKRSAVAHFEKDYEGMLPTSTPAILDYLATYSESLKPATLSQRLSMLSAWHKEMGFNDPCDDKRVRRLLAGIRKAHREPARKAKPLSFNSVSRVVDIIDAQLSNIGDHPEALQDRKLVLTLLRNKALLIIGWFCGFRSHELIKIVIEGCYVEESSLSGRQLKICLTNNETSETDIHTLPEFLVDRRLCPVDAYLKWVGVLQDDEGALFRSITRWGAISDSPLNINSLSKLFKSFLKECGLDAEYSTDSLKQGITKEMNDAGITNNEILLWLRHKNL